MDACCNARVNGITDFECNSFRTRLKIILLQILKKNDSPRISKSSKISVYFRKSQLKIWQITLKLTLSLRVVSRASVRVVVFWTVLFHGPSNLSLTPQLLWVRNCTHKDSNGRNRTVLKMVKRDDALETTTNDRLHLTGSQKEILRYQILNLV